MLPTVFFDKLCIPDAVVRSSRKLHKYIDKTIFPKEIRETLQRSSHLVEIFYDDKPKNKTPANNTEGGASWNGKIADEGARSLRL